MAIAYAGISNVRINQDGAVTLAAWDSDAATNPPGTIYQIYINGKLFWNGTARSVDVTPAAAAGPIVVTVVTVDALTAAADQFAALNPPPGVQVPQAAGGLPPNPWGNPLATATIPGGWGFGDLRPYTGPNPTIVPAPQVYATDEDVFTEVPQDMWNLITPDLCDAYGTDGEILAANPWRLTSAAVDFRARGLKSSQIVWLTQPEAIFGGDPGTAFAVDTIDSGDPHALLLRRIGNASGMGDPPGDGIGDLTAANQAAVTFECRTLRVPLAKASVEVDEQCRVSELLMNRPGRVLAAGDYALIRDMTVYAMLERRYFAMSHGTTIPGAHDTYQDKSKFYAALRADLSTKIVMRFTTGEPTRKPVRYSRIMK